MLLKKGITAMFYSGHENGIAISVAASMMGITSLERHITLDRTMHGCKAASIEFSGMVNLADSIKKKDALEDKLGQIMMKCLLQKLRAHIKID